MILYSEMPAAFIDNSSSRSPKFPNVIREASKTASGKDMGTNERAAFQKNSMKTPNSMPLPTNLSMWRHNNCITSMKLLIMKVMKKTGKKLSSTKVCSRLMRNMNQAFEAAKLREKTQTYAVFAFFKALSVCLRYRFASSTIRCCCSFQRRQRNL